MGRDLDGSFDGELKGVQDGILSLDIAEELALRDLRELPQLAYVPPDALDSLSLGQSPDPRPSSSFQDRCSRYLECPIANRLEIQITHDGLGHQVFPRLLVKSDARTLEVLRLQGERWLVLAVHSGESPVRAEPFDAIELDLAGLWGETSVQ